MVFDDKRKAFYLDKMLACPLRGHWVSFRLVDEFGEGAPYGGLPYKVIDSQGQRYEGILNAKGFAKIENCYRGPVVLQLDENYVAMDSLYNDLINREYYPLPITELQVRAEETRFFHKDGYRVEHNPAQKEADEFFQVEVRDLVKHVAHLPPVAKRFYPPRQSVFKAMGELGFGPEQEDRYGVALMPNKHTILEVRPLRALRPILSTDNEFCALNLYQLALMATITYNDFGQQPPKRPIDKVRFPLNPSFGNLFAETLAGYQEAGRMKPEQPTRFFPIYEDVPYSKRFEIVPFDPVLYEQNRPEQGEKQEHPANINFFDDSGEGTDTQAFISHHDAIILITVRGTQEGGDFLRDGNANQVPFEGGEGKAHEGFYEAYLAIREFVELYLSKFYAGQKIIICGHSLGGAITTLLAEGLRRRNNGYDILLYTYGSPRAGNASFVAGASELVHHRIVNNNDPVPSVPSAWMDTNWNVMVPSAVLGAATPYAWLLFYVGAANFSDDKYKHHGKQQHFMPVKFNNREASAILWDPACESIGDAAICKLSQKQYENGSHDMPDRDGFITQAISHNDHYMVPSYVPLAWATLRRWQETLEKKQTVVTDREYRFIYRAIKQIAEKIAQEIKRSPRPVNFRQREEEPSIVLMQLEAEMSRLNTTVGRLMELHHTRLTPVEVYGNVAESENLKSGLERWMAHEENKVQVKLAMIPAHPDDVYKDGRYQEIDPDPMDQ